MGHERLANAWKRRSAVLDGQGAETRAGIISSVGPDGTTARVEIQPEGNLSGWLPVGCVGVGDNSIIAPPNIGDWVVIEPHEGDAENWIITKRLFNTSQPPPNSPATSAPIKPGEVAIITKGGAYVHLDAAGNIHSGGTWTHTGDLRVTGEVTRGYQTGDQVTLGQHEHDQPADGHGDSEARTTKPVAGT